MSKKMLEQHNDLEMPAQPPKMKILIPDKPERRHENAFRVSRHLGDTTSTLKY